MLTPFSLFRIIFLLVKFIANHFDGQANHFEQFCYTKQGIKKMYPLNLY